MLNCNWQNNYGETYKHLFKVIEGDYSDATYDQEAPLELMSIIEKCFKIDSVFAFNLIFKIKSHFSPEAPNLQTIEPQVLPLNLVKRFSITQDIAEKFYGGLTISKNNKLSIEKAILYPYSNKRYMFRPILVYNIEGKERALVGKEKVLESFVVLSTNAIHWHEMYSEWLELEEMKAYINKKSNEHDKILEDCVQKIVEEKGLLYCRNIKSFLKKSNRNIRIDNEIAGEIDLIVIHPKLKTVIVADAKYNRARYEAIGYRQDYTNFIKDKKGGYELQLAKKVNWIKNNLPVLQEHLKITNTKTDIDLTGYSVEGIFIINTPTFYMFNGAYKAITLKQIGEYLDGKYEFPTFYILDDDNEILSTVNHPYFKNS